MSTETVLKTHYPDGASAFHSVNRRDVYEASVNYTDLRQALMRWKRGDNAEPLGLAEFVDLDNLNRI